MKRKMIAKSRATAARNKRRLLVLSNKRRLFQSKEKQTSTDTNIGNSQIIADRRKHQPKPYNRV